jgi:hypothetical protein
MKWITGKFWISSVYLTMKFYEKYSQLMNKGFLTTVLTDTVFSTMLLEDQTVPKSKVTEIVESVLREQALKGNKFFVDQPQ